MFVGLDLLYEMPGADNYPTVIQGDVIKNVSMDWGWGFRFTLGSEVPMDNWDINLVWMCLPIHHSAGNAGSLLPVWSNAPQNSSSFVSQADTFWRLHLGIVDLGLERAWSPSRRFTMAPDLGVRFASIRQKFFLRYSGGNLFPNDFDDFHAKNKYWGIGPYLKIHGSWHLSEHWSIWGRTEASLLYGQSYLHESEKREVFPTFYLKLLETFSQAASVYALALGLSWESDDTLIHLSWEENVFPNQNKLKLFPSQTVWGKNISNSSSLSLSGVSLGAKFFF